MMHRLTIALVLMLAAGGAGAQPTPTVTEQQRLTLQNIGLRMQLAEARAQLAQAEYTKARDEAAALLATMQVQGYTLDPNTLVYTKASDPKVPK